MALIINIDGGSRGNPGPAGAGVVIRRDDGTLLYEAGFFLGRRTNNAAEYLALLKALELAAGLGEANVSVFSDSELLVRQITGQYRVRNQRLAELFETVQHWLLKIPCWQIRHVPREENRRADELANLAMDRGEDIVVVDNTGRAPDGQTPATKPSPSPQPPVAGPCEAVVLTASPAGKRAVRVTVVEQPACDACPAADNLPASFVVKNTLPPDVCIYAAHALLPTIIAILNTEPNEFAAVPTLTVRCMKPECGAAFHVAPVRSTNGA